MDKKYKEKLGILLSEQLNIELMASKLYFMAYQYLDSRELALKNIAKFFYKEVYEELKHAKGIIDFMNNCEIPVTYKDTIVDIKFKSFIDVFEIALKYEEIAYQNILKIYEYADNIKDFSTTQFLDPYIEEQVKDVKEYSDLLANARRCQDGFGLVLFDTRFRK